MEINIRPLAPLELTVIWVKKSCMRISVACLIKPESHDFLKKEKKNKSRVIVSL